MKVIRFAAALAAMFSACLIPATGVMAEENAEISASEKQTGDTGEKAEKVTFVTSHRATPSNVSIQGAKAERTEDGSVGEKAEKKTRPIEGEKTVSGYAANPYGEIISAYARKYGVPEALAHAVVQVESNFRANVTGAAGEIGLMQLKLSTARMMGYHGSAKALYDPETNIKYGMKYLAKAQELGNGSVCGTILKYNAGHGATSMNPISARYCTKVTAML